jgi:hypothetical protein
MYLARYDPALGSLKRMRGCGLNWTHLIGPGQSIPLHTRKDHSRLTDYMKSHEQLRSRAACEVGEL